MPRKKNAVPKKKKQPAFLPSLPVVGIGASAGGLEAFKQFFMAMPPDTGMAFVLIQHLDPTHESLMADLLSRYTQMKALQTDDGMPIEANTIYLIPPNRDLTIDGGKLCLMPPSAPRGLRMPIDTFLRSLAENQKERGICIILSGTGSDGTLGLKAIKDYGGLVIVQEPASAQYDGMPSSAIATGVVDFILPVDEMPKVLINYIHHSYVKGYSQTSKGKLADTDDLMRVLKVIQVQTGRDFSHYKSNTIDRRIKRRMGLNQIETVADYVACLKQNPDETKSLFKDLLIGVTGFFREPESWLTLAQKGLPELLEDKENDHTFRFWVPGCSTGEEAYTIGMLLLEQFEAISEAPSFQIFATDIDENALDIARSGRYPASIAADVNSRLLRKYFQKDDQFYHITPALRDTVVFSIQDMISDPPFSKIDLVSCRNLLIYLDAEIQKKLIPLFHFSLKDKGLLTLGSSETIGPHEHLFEPISKKWRIYRRIATVARTNFYFPIVDDRHLERVGETRALAIRHRTNIPEIAGKVLLSAFAPASVLINTQHQILYHFGNMVDYLHYPTGEPTIDLFEVLREGLKVRVRALVNKSIKDRIKVVTADARVKRDGNFRPVRVSVFPIEERQIAQDMFIICFEDLPHEETTSLEPSTINNADENVIKHLEYELRSTREELQNTIEEMESSNEELKASNEEVMSMNEELQASNEELETSKEELQSLNEELHTVNSQLQEKVEELSLINNDLNNLINSTQIATIFLDTKMHIKRYTPAIKTLFNLIATDIGRPLADIALKFSDDSLIEDVEKVLDTLKFSKKEIVSDNGRWFYRRILPYRTQDNNIDGIVVLFDDITRVKESEERFRAIFEQTSESAVLSDDATGDLIEFNKKAYQNLGYNKNEFAVLNIQSLIVPEHWEKYIKHVRRTKKKGFDLFEVHQKNKSGDVLNTQISSRLVSIKGKHYIQSIWWRFGD